MQSHGRVSRATTGCSRAAGGRHDNGSVRAGGSDARCHDHDHRCRPQCADHCPDHARPDNHHQYDYGDNVDNDDNGAAAGCVRTHLCRSGTTERHVARDRR